MAVSVETVINNVARTLLDTAFRTWSRAEHVANLNIAQRLICGDYKLDAYPKREFVALVAGIAQDIPAEGTALIDITDNEVSQRSVTQTDLAILQEENRFWVNFKKSGPTPEPTPRNSNPKPLSAPA